MITLGNVTWGSSPKIPIKFEYEKQRSGADMQYRVKITISPVTGASYFGYPIYWSWNIDGVDVGSYTLKSANPNRWSTAITYTTAWYTVKNKTTGTTALKVRVYSGSGSSRSNYYNYTMAVDPAASVISAAKGTLGAVLTLTLTRYNTAFKDTITYTCGDVTGTVVSGSTTTSVTWDANNGNTVALAAQNPNGQSVNITFTVSSYDGTTLVGTSSMMVSCAIPDSVKPSVVLNIEDAAGYLASYGAYVQGYSKLKITATPTLAYGSAIKSYEIKADGVTYTTSPVTTNAVKGTGTLPVTAKVTDNRTRPSDTVTSNITVLPYEKPKVNFSAYRCNSSGAADPEGAYMKIVVTSTISSLNNKNTATYKIVHSGGTITGSGTSYTSGALTCDVSYTHNIEVTITDRLSSTTKAAVIPIAYTLTDYYNSGKGISFGKVGTREGFDCAMPAYFTGGVYIDDQPLDDYIVDQGTSGIWTYRKWNSGVAECWGSHKEASLNCGESHAGGFYYSKSVTVPFPVNLFSAAPLVVIDGGSYSYVNFVRNFGSDSTQAIFIAVGLTSITADVFARIYAKGTWK